MKNEKTVKERNLHPSVFKKVITTQDLIKKGVHPDEFISRGGLDLKTFNSLKKKYKHKKQLIEGKKQKIISKYGSLRAAPISIGPCKVKKPVIGAKNALVLLTEFKDVKHTTPPDYFQEQLF